MAMAGLALPCREYTCLCLAGCSAAYLGDFTLQMSLEAGQQPDNQHLHMRLHLDYPHSSTEAHALRAPLIAGFILQGGSQPAPAAAPAGPPLPTLLPGDKGKGLTIAGRLARENGQIGALQASASADNTVTAGELAHAAARGQGQGAHDRSAPRT